MIIDTHVHVWEISEKYPVGPTAPNWKSLPDEPGTADELLKEMDACDVDRSVLVQTSWSTWDNGYIADAVARWPERFIGHGLIDPQDPKNAAQVRYWMEERGLAGFRFHPMYYRDEKILLTAQNEALWETIARMDAVIQFHLDPSCADQVAQIARCYPHLRLLLDHMGYPRVGANPAFFRPIVDLAVFPNVLVKLSDVAGRSQQSYPYGDVHADILRLMDAFGPQRVLWGTGYPGHHRVKNNWPTLADELRLVREGLDFLDIDSQQAILGDNAIRLWRLD